MGKKDVLGIFSDVDKPANALDELRKAGFSEHQFDILTDTPYPEGTFGEKPTGHKLFRFPLIGAAVGLAAGILYSAATQLAYPLVTGGKPILALPPMVIIIYEATMLSAILFTVFGILFESRLPRLIMGAYDTRITEGYIGILVSCPETDVAKARDALQAASAEDIKEA